MSETVGQIDLGLNINRKMFNDQLNGISKYASNSVNNSFRGIGSKIGSTIGSSAEKTAIPSFKGIAKSITSILGTIAVGSFVKDCLDLGSDLTEVQNVVDTVFTSMSGTVNEFAKNAATTYGLSETMAKKFTGTFGAMATSMGITEGKAVEMSTALTGLTGDVASFYNISQDEAYTKLKSVFTGETEALKELGVVMTQTNLKQYALNHGITGNISGMTQQQKVMLQYQYVTDALSKASGDFAKTSDRPTVARYSNVA